MPDAHGACTAGFGNVIDCAYDCVGTASAANKETVNKARALDIRRRPSQLDFVVGVVFMGQKRRCDARLPIMRSRGEKSDIAGDDTFAIAAGPVRNFACSAETAQS